MVSGMVLLLKVVTLLEGPWLQAAAINETCLIRQTGALLLCCADAEFRGAE